MRAPQHTSTRAYIAVTFVGAIAAACTRFSANNDLAQPIVGPPAAAPVDAPVGAPAGTDASPGDAGDASVTPDGGCIGLTVSEAFNAGQVPSSWTPVLSGGGHVDVSPDALSKPFALRAFGTLSTGSSSTALIRTTRVGAVRGEVDLTYQLTFETLPSDARLDAGCTLELVRGDGTSARARISASFGIADEPAGIAARVDVQNGAGATISAPPPQLLSGQMGTLAWYRFHIHATAEAASVRFDIDLQAPSIVGTAPGMTVPFTDAEGIVLSCGVDGAYSDPSGNGAAYGVRLDDIALSTCP
jgi:hypothetical protein